MTHEMCKWGAEGSMKVSRVLERGFKEVLRLRNSYRSMEDTL